MLGSFVALAVLSNLHERPSLTTIISWIDFDTCALLFGRLLFPYHVTRYVLFRFIICTHYNTIFFSSLIL